MRALLFLGHFYLPVPVSYRSGRWGYPGIQIAVSVHAYSCSRPLRNSDIKKRCLEVLRLGAKKRCMGPGLELRNDRRHTTHTNLGLLLAAAAARPRPRQEPQEAAWSYA